MTDIPIQLSHNRQENITLLSNDFIDRYMCQADGEYVKIYLMILRLSNSGMEVTPDVIADRLNLTQKDVLRAISYWEKAGLLQPLIPQDRSQDVSPDTGERKIPRKQALTPTQISASKDCEDFSRTVFMAETYLGRPFSHTELNTLCYIRDQLEFSPELLEYLIEYCVSRDKKSIRYIEQVAIEWYRKDIRTVAQAKEESSLYSRNVFPVLKAFGISGRLPAASELEYINRWTSWGLPTDIIVEACNRTILATHQASFPYADRIISEWYKKGILTRQDIDRQDQEFQQKKREPASSKRFALKGNSFHNFEQRTYDYQELETRLLHRKEG